MYKYFYCFLPYLYQGNLAKSTSSDDLELLEVSYLQVQVKYSIEKWLDELTEPLLLLVSGGCNNPDCSIKKEEEKKNSQMTIDDRMRAPGNGSNNENDLDGKEARRKDE